MNPAVALLSLAMLAPAQLPELPKIIAHRGASHAAPENTLAAFKLAWEEGADGIEGDFRLTQDGEVACIHDEDTKRTAGRKLSVATTPWNELATLDVGRWKNARFAGEPIPRLGEVLGILPQGKYFFIEIKSGPETVEPIARILAGHDADPARVMLIAFDERVVARCRERLPQYEAHWISSLKDFGRQKARDGYLGTLARIRATGLQFNGKVPVTPEWIARVKQPGRKVASWTVDDAATARRVIGAGVDFITSNRPGALRRELGGGG